MPPRSHSIQMIYEALKCLQLLAQVFEGTTLSRPWTNPKANATIDIEDRCDVTSIIWIIGYMESDERITCGTASKLYPPQA